jgi:hypothetical protein
MRLDFNVLWIDDQPDRVGAQIMAIKKQMADEGFEFAPKLCKSMSEIHDAISSDVFTDEIDLILVDWDLVVRFTNNVVVPRFLPLCSGSC